MESSLAVRKLERQDWICRQACCKAAQPIGTIRPVPYPGRTPHIHVAVYRPGARPFVTQLYVADEARNDSDFLYQRVPVEQRHLVTAAFSPSRRPEVELEAQWDLILDVAPTA